MSLSGTTSRTMGDPEMLDTAECRILHVNVATGWIDETVFFERHGPRITVRRVSQDGTRIERSMSTTISINPR